MLVLFSSCKFVFFFLLPKKTEFHSLAMLCGQVTSRSEFEVRCKNQEPRLGPKETPECWKQVESKIMSTEREGRSLQVSGKGQRTKTRQEGSERQSPGCLGESKAKAAVKNSTGQVPFNCNKQP